MKKYKVTIIFTVVCLTGAISLGYVISNGIPALPILVISFGSIVWALRKSDTDGFHTYKRMRRAGDPNPQFHILESSILFFVLVAQFISACYIVMTG